MVSQKQGIEILVQYDDSESTRLLYSSMTKWCLAIFCNALNYSQGSSIHIIQQKKIASSLLITALELAYQIN